MVLSIRLKIATSEVSWEEITVALYLLLIIRIIDLKTSVKTICRVSAIGTASFVNLSVIPKIMLIIHFELSVVGFTF